MPTLIKAKVTVTDVIENDFGAGKYSEQVRMQPVYSDSEENKSYSDATPSGSIELTITNKSAWGFFVAGREYYVDFTPA